MRILISGGDQRLTKKRVLTKNLPTLQECKQLYNTLMRVRCVFAVLLVLLLAACAPAALSTATPVPSAPAATFRPATILPGTAIAGTAVAGTAVIGPGSGTPRPVLTPPPATPIPTLPSGLGPTALKYRLLDQYPDLFFCDPDFYPVARANEADLAQQRFPQIQANAEEFQAILGRLGLSSAASLSDEQKLLIYREHKRLAALLFELEGNGYQFQFQVKESSGQGFIIKGFIDGSGTVTVQSRQPGIATCPICLAEHTLIDTPQGAVAVEDLRVGDVVWTVSPQGERLAAPIVWAVRVPVPAGHRVVHLALDDGRQLWASPGHPTADGRVLGQLRPGDRLDGGQVRLAELAPYGGPATYDILPAGGTGFYWAGGILVGSTLAP